MLLVEVEVGGLVILIGRCNGRLLVAVVYDIGTNTSCLGETINTRNIKPGMETEF